MQIHQLEVKSSKKIKRIGRGGKKGTYSGRGGKGQSARSGFSRRATFEGGMSTLIARTKKLRGFKSLRPKNQIVNLAELELKFSANEEISPKTLLEKRIIRDAKQPVKILSEGELTKKLVFSQVSVSKAAKEKIEKVGGEIKEQ